MDQTDTVVVSASKKRPLPTILRRGLSRVESALYVGVSPTKFDEMVAHRTMPKAKRIDSRVVWDLWELDEAFTELPNESGKQPIGAWTIT